MTFLSMKKWRFLSNKFYLLFYGVALFLIFSFYFFEHGTKGDAIMDINVLRHSIDNRLIEVMNEISIGNIKNTVSDLQDIIERSSWEKQEITCQYIIRKLHSLDLKPEVDEYTYKNRVFKNIVVTFVGKQEPLKRIVVVSHYDTKNLISGLPSPGADDNGTGVSILLEIARTIRNIDHQKTWQIIFFSNEEKGQKGSHDYARKQRLNNSNIVSVISADAFGYRNPGFSEIISLLESSLDIGRKSKGVAKVLYNNYLSIKNGHSTLKLAFRKSEANLAPPKHIREAFGNAIYWQIGSACA